MADRPAVKNEAVKRETAKKDEAYQPLWDTDQSVCTNLYHSSCWFLLFPYF